MPTLKKPKATPVKTLDLEAIFATDESLATYLSTLTPDQVDNLRQTIEADASIPDPAKQSLVRLMNVVYVEARTHVAALEASVLPLANGIATAMKLCEQISDLEQLAASMHIPLES